ncbi:MAG: S-layer homology domain-containing protein, partial [Candidatus Margulisiibacteriota bacterium]
LNADLGLLYHPLYIAWLSLGLNYQNALGGAIKWNNAAGTEDLLGSTIKIGSAFIVLGSKEALFQMEKQKLMLAVDFDLINASVLSDQSSDLKIGLEYSPLSISGLSLRAGYDCNAGVGLGVGFEKSGFRFDYAYYQNSAVSGNNPSYFSLAYTIPPPARKLFEPQETSTPYIRIDKPKDQTITPELSIQIKGIAKQITQKGFWAPSTEAFITYEATNSGTLEKIIQMIPVEIFQTISYEVRPIENLIDVRLNGNSMPYNKLGIFETMLKLNPALNRITIEAITTAEGTVTKESVRVLRYIPFSDTSENHWAIRSIAFISTFKIITGYPDDTFKPDNPITRAELVTLLMKAKGGAFTGSLEVAFKDVKPNHWAAPYIYQANLKGIVKGYPDNTFRPTQNLTRAEGVAILARFAEIEAGRDLDLVPFPDLPEGFWANEFISKAKSAGMLKYLAKKSFDPKVPFTRCEAAEVLFLTPFIQDKENKLWETGVVFAPTISASLEVKP